MFLRHLINPKPSIIGSFIVFCVLFVSIPLINIDISALFSNNYLHCVIVFLFALIAPFFLALGLNNMIYEKNIIKKENLVLGFIFILLSSPFINCVELWISSFLLLFLFNYLIGSYQKDLPFSYFYNASMLLGVLSFLYPNLIFLFCLLIIHGINYSNLNWRIIVISLLGLATPYIFYFVFAFVTENNFLIPNFFDFSIVNISLIQNLSLSETFFVATVFIVMCVSFLELFLWLYKKSIKSRRSFMTVIWFCVISLLITFYSGIDYFYFSLLPLSIIAANYFVYTKNRRIANFLFFILLISSLYYRYMIGFNV